MSGRLAQVSLFVVALIIGVLLIGQLRSQARPIELSSLSAQELTTLIQTLQARNAELSAGLTDLREQIRTYESDEARGQSSLDTTRENLERIAAFAGLRAVEGQGLVMRMEGSFDPTAVNDIINELRNAGAEAIAVDDIRITARSVAVLGTGVIEIDGIALGSTVEIKAIGAPEGLRSAMQRPGGILAYLEQSIQATFTLDTRLDLELPATERDLTPQAARAVE